MKRVLMVCYYFPPLGAVSGLRAAKQATYLPDFGWAPLVVAPRQGVYYRDPSLSFPETNVLRTASLEMSRLGKRVIGQNAGGSEPARLNPALNVIREMAHRWLYRPDPQVGWYPFAVHSARIALRKQRFNAIFSSSVPFTAHRIARRLHKDSGLPWVAEFRDPWAEALDAHDPLRRRRLREEREVLDVASAVVTVSPDWARLFRAKGVQDVAVITNGFDPREFPAPHPPDSFVLTHVGNFYPAGQDLSTLWPALRAARETMPLGKSWRLRFVGPLHPVLAGEIAAHGLSEMLEHKGFLPHHQALSEIMSSSALLIAGSRDDRTELKGWIPAKVFEYLASGLPIIYIGNLNTDAATLLADQPGCYVVAPGDADGALAALRAAAGGVRFERDVSRYTHRALAEELACVLDRAAA